MRMIDAHHHLWNPDSNQPEVGYVWLKKIGQMKPFGNPTEIQRDYFLSEFLDELSDTEYQMVGSVHVQCDAGIISPEKETAWIDSEMKKHNFPMATVGYLNLADDSCKMTLEKHLKYPHLRGIRQIIAYLKNNPTLNFCQEEFLKNNTWKKNYKWFSEHSLSFDLQLYPEQMVEAADFFSQYQTPLAIDHAGSPYNQSLKGFNLWLKNLEELAKIKHCFIKLSGWGMYDTNWSAASLKDWYQAIESLFGVKRMMFGSNFPVDKLMKTYPEVVDETLKLIKTYSTSLNESPIETEEKINSIFYKTTKDFYRI